MAISNWAGAPVEDDDDGVAMGDGVALSDGDGVGDSVALSDGEGEFVGPGVDVAPPVGVGVAPDEPHAPATMTTTRAAPTPRSLALPYRLGADTRSLCRIPLANMPLPPVGDPAVRGLATSDEILTSDVAVRKPSDREATVEAGRPNAATPAPD